MRRFLLWSALLAVVLAATSSIAPPTSRAQTQIDISGHWSTTIEGDLVAACTNRFTQSGAELSATISCAEIGTGAFTGSIDPSTGDFRLNGLLLGFSVELDGSLSGDGSEMTGTWAAAGLSGTFHGTLGSMPLPTVDLSGDWMVELVSTNSVSCSASLEQSDSQVDGTLECEGLGSGTLTGTVGGNSLTLQGIAPGSTLDIVANVSPDENVITGSYSSGTFLAVRREERSGSIDLSGNWTTRLSAGIIITCQTALEQNGEDLSAIVDCDIGGPATSTLRGEIDSETGNYRLAGSLAGPVVLLGLAAADGTSTIGAWAAPSLGFSGVFTSDRLTETPMLIDLTDNWELALAGDAPSVCMADVVQALTRLEVRVACEELGAGDLRGTISPLDGEFRVFGTLDAVYLELEGRLDQDIYVMQGSWRTSPTDGADDEVRFGCFIATNATSGEAPPCEPPSRDPGISFGGSSEAILDDALEAVETPESERLLSSNAGSSSVLETTRWVIVAMAGLLGAGLGVLAVWRLRLRR